MYGIFSLFSFVRAVKHSCQKHVMTSSRTSLPRPASGSLLASITITSKLYLKILGSLNILMTSFLTLLR